MRYTAEAEKIRWTYLAALEARLSNATSEERLEMVSEIRDHLDDAARTLETDVIDGKGMSELIARVGNVEVLATADDDGQAQQLPPELGPFEPEGSKAFTAQWEGVHDGHTIRVVNKYNVLLFGSGHLYVDDKLLAEDKGWANYSSTVSGTITDADGSKLSIRARLATEDKSQGVVCRVWVNRVEISVDLIQG